MEKNLTSTTADSLGSARQPVHGLIRRDDTIRRLPVYGYGFSMSWAADNRQFVSLLDGWGLPNDPVHKLFHGHLLTVAGEALDPVFGDLTSAPDFLVYVPETDVAAYFGCGCLAVDGFIYQFLSTTNVGWLKPDKSFPEDYRWNGAKLIYSPDNGRTWYNQDGSSPVRAERWQERSRTNMLFYDEQPPGAFSLLSILQMGKNYQDNRDGYVYVYSPNGVDDGTMNQLVMFRVPKARILERRSYEFFSGLRSDGTATWTPDVSARAPVHTFPRGWVNRHYPGELAWAWVPSVVYNAPLGVYMMASWGTKCDAEGSWFAKPSYLGVWVAPTPWGPFTQIHEELAWTPGNDQAARCWYPQIAPKWISEDGKSLWLVWSDIQYRGPTGETTHADAGVMDAAKNIKDNAEFVKFYVDFIPKHVPYALFNMQRVDLIVR